MSIDVMPSVSGHGTLDPVRITQVGSTDQCGKEGCGIRNPWWRVGLGRFEVQAYACSAHLGWAVALDMLCETSGKAMGWRVKRGTIEPVWVDPCMPAILRMDYTRTPDVSAQFPQACQREDGTYGHRYR